MKLLDFVRAAKAERDAMALTYSAANAGSAVGGHLAKAKLTDAQRKEVTAAIDQVLTDAFYTMMLALDGAASLGTIQQSYRILMEDGSEISAGDGSLESAAFQVFQQ